MDVKIQIDDYKTILDNNKNHFDKLYTICKEIGEKVEGNCFTAHLNIDYTINELIYKQLNHFSLGMNATNIMEIGFNAGHSSLLYLLANPNSKLIYEYDPYVIYMRKLLDMEEDSEEDEIEI